MKTKIVKARKNFSVEDHDTGESVKVKRGEIGQLLEKRPGKPYIVLINEKTLTFSERQALRYLFKITRAD